MTDVVEVREVNKTVKETTVTAINCDRCGADTLSGKYEKEGARFEMHFGWGSRFDDESWEFDSCDDCAEWVADQFKTGRRR